MKPNILSLHLMNIKTQNKNNITYNGCSMRSSGFKILNFREQMNYNRRTNAEYTNETAISYTACYAQYGLFSTN